MTHIWSSRFYNKPGDPKFCRESVYSRESGQILAHSYQCQRKPVVFRAVNGAEYGFCKQHDPEAVAARNKARQEQWRTESEARNREYDRRKQTTKALDACKAAIEKIATGCNDARALAMETLALFPERDNAK